MPDNLPPPQVTPPAALGPRKIGPLGKLRRSLYGCGRVMNGGPAGIALRKLWALPFWAWHGIEFSNHENWKQYPLLPHRRPFIENLGRMVFGRHVYIRCASRQVFLGTLHDAEILVGDHVMFNEGCEIGAHRRIEISSFARIGMGARIYDTSFHTVSPEETKVRTAPIRIGWNAWIGQGATVLPGISIGDHAVVGAGSIVTADVPARSVVVGSPARVIREFQCPDDWVRH